MSNLGHPLLHVEIGLLRLLSRVLRALAIAIGMAAGIAALGFFWSAGFVWGQLETLAQAAAGSTYPAHRHRQARS